MTEVTRYDGQVITGSIKAWNTDKGFGFAQVDDGGDDIFMHQSVIEVEDNKFRAIAPGTKVEVTYFDRDGKHTASRVTGVNGSAFKGFASKSEAAQACSRPAGSSDGSVKWYNTEKGFGFIIPSEGGKDVFFSIKDVEGQQILRENEPVIYFVTEVENNQVKATKVKSLQNRQPPLNPGMGGFPGQQAPAQYGFPPQYPSYTGPQYPQQPVYSQQPMGMMQGGYPPQQYPSSGGAAVRSGTCKWYNVTKAFGFILPSDGGKDLYFRECNPAPQPGDPLEYEIKVIDGKPAGVNVVNTKNRKRKGMEPIMNQPGPLDPYAPQQKSQRPGPAYNPHNGPSAAYDPYASQAPPQPAQNAYNQGLPSYPPSNGYQASQQQPNQAYSGYPPSGGMPYY